MKNVAGCFRNWIHNVRVWEGLFDNQGRNVLTEILTHFRRAAISAQLPRHRLRVTDGIGDEKFSAEEGADKALVAVKCANKFSTCIALHWIIPKKVRAHILEEHGAHKTVCIRAEATSKGEAGSNPGAEARGDETPHAPETSCKG